MGLGLGLRAVRLLFSLLLINTTPPQTPTLFPYTTLFRSRERLEDGEVHAVRLCPDRQGVGELAARHRLECQVQGQVRLQNRKSTRLNSSHTVISYAVFCLKKKKLTVM